MELYICRMRDLEATCMGQQQEILIKDEALDSYLVREADGSLRRVLQYVQMELVYRNKVL